MPRFLSGEWIAELASAAQGLHELPDGAPLPTAVIEQVVTRADGTEVRWHLRSTPDGVHLGAGAAPEPAHAVLQQDEATAVAVATGQLNAQQAFISGGLRLRGDVDVLLRAAALFAALEERFAPVRAATLFPDPAASPHPGAPGA